jgi:multiple sugar transport system ATP-binding protein
MTMADRIVVMNKGDIEQVGAPLDLYDHPASLFVAEFIGSPAMNLFDGTIAQDGRFRSRDGWTVPVETGRGLAAGRPVVLGLRPEHLAVAADGPIAAQLLLVEHLGPESFIYCGGGRSGLICVRGGRQDDPPRGDVRLRVEAHAAHLFDAETGRSLRVGGGQ